MIRRILFIIVGVTAIFCFAHLSQAQNTSLGIAAYLPLSESNLPNGSIVSSSDKGFVVSAKPYDQGLFGVVSDNPAVSFGEDENNGSTAVISTGNAIVRVVTSNGPIKKGDLITSSEIKGVGMKVTRSGFTVGTALEDYTSSNQKQEGLIAVAVNIHYYATKPQTFNTISSIFDFSVLAASDEPMTYFKYIIASIIVISSFALGFFSFGRIATTGIEAIGRNPLASRMIQLGIVFNVFVTISIIAGGIIIALFILRL